MLIPTGYKTLPDECRLPSEAKEKRQLEMRGDWLTIHSPQNTHNIAKHSKIIEAGCVFAGCFYNLNDIIQAYKCTRSITKKKKKNTALYKLTVVRCRLHRGFINRTVTIFTVTTRIQHFINLICFIAYMSSDHFSGPGKAVVPVCVCVRTTNDFRCDVARASANRPLSESKASEIIKTVTHDTPFVVHFIFGCKRQCKRN